MLPIPKRKYRATKAKKQLARAALFLGDNRGTLITGLRDLGKRGLGGAAIGKRPDPHPEIAVSGGLDFRQFDRADRRKGGAGLVGIRAVLERARLDEEAAGLALSLGQRAGR